MHTTEQTQPQMPSTVRALGHRPHSHASSRDQVPSMGDIASFQAVRPRLFGIASRVLGSAADAEDVVQDAWLRWQTADRSNVLDPAALLATTTTRLAINLTQSARARRETLCGGSLPEPTDIRADPTLGVERGEALEFAVRTLLARLSASERAAYVLREAFDYSYRQIADVLKIRDTNARQLVRRARQGLSRERRSAPVSALEQRRLIDAFVAAAERGNLAVLEQVLTADMTLPADHAEARTRCGMPTPASGYVVVDLRGADRTPRRSRRAPVRSPQPGSAVRRPNDNAVIDR